MKHKALKFNSFAEVAPTLFREHVIHVKIIGLAVTAIVRTLLVVMVSYMPEVRGA
jgi:hypothetical protein